jgi:hypothetical protein
MSAAIGFGEFEALLCCDTVNAALAFSRELFSREYVVQRVTREVLAAGVQSSEEQWRGLARIHTGHVIVSVDGIPVRGLSSRQFAELWYPRPTPADASEAPNELRSQRRARFRDRRRAELEVQMQKDWASSGPMRFTPVQDDVELQSKLREAHGLLWGHQLTQAHAVLQSLPAGSDPMICLLAVELEAVRVLTSKDALYAKQAQRAASRAVAWLESLSEVTSLSYSSRKQMQLALAEALFLSALLRLSGDQRLAAVASARRSAAIYAELNEKFFTKANAAAKRGRLLMPERELKVFRKRIQFGMGVLHVGGALALQSSLDWVGALLKGACDIKKGVEYLVDCGSVEGESGLYQQANWAALAFMHSSAAIRLIRQREPDSERGCGDQLAQVIADCQHAALQRHPNALLFLWSQATASNFDNGRLEQLEMELARVAADAERAHLVRFDVGYRRFLAREFNRSSAQFMPICKCASAPAKLRGLSSLFVAVGYLLPSQGASVLDAKLVDSVRLLLRSARRFLALRLENNGEDLEAAALHERLGDYLEGSDEYLQVLPWEVLYVYCHPTNTLLAASKLNKGQHKHHLAALEQLGRLRQKLEDSKRNHDAELCLLRTIALFNLREFDACDQELQRLWSELLPSGDRPRTTSALGRLLSQRSGRSVPAFVAPVAWFYQLRLILERRCSRSTLSSIEKVSADPASSPKGSKPGVSSYTGTVHAVYPYHHVYSGKLQALNKLVARLANDKIDNSM